MRKYNNIQLLRSVYCSIITLVFVTLLSNAYPGLPLKSSSVFDIFYRLI